MFRIVVDENDLNTEQVEDVYTGIVYAIIKNIATESEGDIGVKVIVDEDNIIEFTSPPLEDDQGVNIQNIVHQYLHYYVRRKGDYDFDPYHFITKLSKLKQIIDNT